MSFLDKLEQERDALKALGEIKAGDAVEEGVVKRIKKAYHKNRASANAKKLRRTSNSKRKSKYASKMRSHGSKAK